MSDTCIVGMSLHFTPEAKNTVARMSDRCANIAAVYGPESKLAIEAYRSLAHCLATLIGLAGRITKDGDLSLYGINEFIHYGVNWSPRPIPPEYLGLTDVEPGTWSVNS